ncbi:MAG: AAA family ATPase [Thermoplasmata archaeon]
MIGMQEEIETLHLTDKDHDFIKDPQVFLPSYIPQKIYIRDEFEKLYLKLSGSQPVAPLYMVVGRRGSGKTLFARSLALRLGDAGIPSFYVDATTQNTSRKILGHILLQPRQEYRELLDLFISRVGRSGSGSVYLIIDNAQFLKDMDLMEHFLRHQELGIKFITTSLGDFWSYALLRKFKNLTPERIDLHDYGPDELFQIMEYRAGLGLVSHDQQSLRAVAEYIAGEYRGDSSVAVRILPRIASAGWPRERERIEPLVRGFIEQDLMAILRDLPERDLMVLFSAIYEHDLEPLYSVSSRFAREILSYGLSQDRIRTAINNLVNMGLVVFVPADRGSGDSGGQRQRYSLRIAFDRRLVVMEVVKRYRSRLREILADPANQVGSTIRFHSSFSYFRQYFLGD